MIDYPLHAYAIVCDNGCIADAEGRFPDILRNDADWLYFQSRLDRAAITLMGRRSHETNANHRNRLRLVMSRSVSALEHRADGWWWNPAERSLPGALQMIIPEGGEVAVPGGRDVFDLLGLQALPHSTSREPMDARFRGGEGCSACAKPARHRILSCGTAGSGPGRCNGSTRRIVSA